MLIRGVLIKYCILIEGFFVNVWYLTYTYFILFLVFKISGGTFFFNYVTEMDIWNKTITIRVLGIPEYPQSFVDVYSEEQFLSKLRRVLSSKIFYLSDSKNLETCIPLSSVD